MASTDGPTGASALPTALLGPLDRAQELYRTLVAPRVPPGLFAALLISAALAHLYVRTSAVRKGVSGKGEGGDDGPVLKDIFATHGRDGNVSKDNAGGGDVGRPFSSSYYYAHNGQGKGGGYSDGLRTEDYVMNGPRLLSRGGKQVEDEKEAAITKGDGAKGGERDGSRQRPPTSSSSSSSSSVAAAPAIPPGSVPIQRYMWDDTAETSGCSDAGKLYIDTLPGPQSHLPDLAWRDASIARGDVTVELGAEGRSMLVLVRRAHATGAEPRAYHLLVPRTYGEVAEVRVAVKAKRLLVKLVKKRKHGMNMWDKSNLKPWPQLSEKVMAGGATAGKVDEGLLRKAEEVARNGGARSGGGFDESFWEGMNKANKEKVT